MSEKDIRGVQTAFDEAIAARDAFVVQAQLLCEVAAG